MIAEYYYDPFGRRLWKDVGGVRTYFHYADEGLVGEYDSSGAEIKTYGYKPGSTWTTDPIFIKQNNQYYFYHNDHLGTPQKITAMNGAVAWSAKYDSFGEATIDPSSTITNNLRFPGQYYDEETGLHYNGYRYYDSNTGRYLRTDPSHHLINDRAFPFILPFLLGIPQELNDYTYVGAPTNLSDPTGLFGKCEIICDLSCHLGCHLLTEGFLTPLRSVIVCGLVCTPLCHIYCGLCEDEPEEEPPVPPTEPPEYNPQGPGWEDTDGDGINDFYTPPPP